ncbi:MAG: hypothetical protein E7395_01210, partial [Ruminococcaceae bacterium]|nr:hypothetical protein [Oscillospiraceae bacterium]
MMRKYINKTLALLLVSIMCVPALTICASSGCYNVLGTTIWNFSGVDVDNCNMENYIGTTLNNYDELNNFKISEVDGEKALHAYIAKGYSSIPTDTTVTNAKNVNAATYYDKGNYFTKLSLDFKIKRTTPAYSDFGVFLRDYTVTESSEQQAEVMQLRSEGYIRFLGYDVTTYSADKWYDIKMLIDFDARMGSIGIKGETDNECTYYNVPFSLLPKPGSDSCTITLSKAAKICYMFVGASRTAEQNVYITNIKQNTFSDALTGEMTCYTQNFESSTTLSDHAMSIHKSHQYPGTEVSTANLSDSKSYFLLENGSGDSNTSYSIETIDGNNVLALTKNTGSTKTGQCVQKYVNAALFEAITNHRFSLKIGGSKDGAAKQIYLRPTSGSANMVAIVRIYNGIVQIKDGTSWVNVENLGENYNPKHLYQCDIYYNTKTRKAIYSVTDTAGEVHTKSLTLDSDLERFIIQNSTTSGAASTMYIDDYVWYVYRESTDSEDAKTSIESKLYDDASLDEYVVFDYNEPISSESLANVTVMVTADGKSAEATYTLDSKKGSLGVRLKDLEPSTEYEVSVSGAQTILGRT